MKIDPNNVILVNKAMELMAEKIRSREPLYKNWPLELVIFSFLMRAELEVEKKK